MRCPHQIKECKGCGRLQCCVWYKRNRWCKLCLVICLLQLALDSDDEESPRPEKSSDILGSEIEDKTRKRKRHTSLDSDDEDSQRTQEPSDTLGDKDTATERKLRAFVTDSLGDEYDRIKGCRCACMWLRSKPNVIDLVRFSMEALEQQHYRLARNWKRRSKRDKFQALIESCDKDTFSARYSIDALVQYHSELARLWTYRSEIDKNKDPVEPGDKDIFSARYSMNAIVHYHSELARLWTYRSEIDKRLMTYRSEIDKSKDPIEPGDEDIFSAHYSMKAIVKCYYNLLNLWTHRSEIDKSKDPIEPGDEDIFSARYSINAIVQYHSELARLWTYRSEIDKRLMTYRSEIDKSKDPIASDDQDLPRAQRWPFTLSENTDQVAGASNEQLRGTSEETLPISSSETWAGTLAARTFSSAFRIFSKDENLPSANLTELHQDQPKPWVPPPPPDPPNPY